MKLKKARVQNYWSVHDSGWFDIEGDKTVIVGPNEAGKTAVLRALQTVNLPPGRALELDPLRDYPRSRYREIDEGLVELSDAIVATAVFALEDHDRVVLGEFAPHLETATELHLSRYYDGSRRYWFGDLEMWAHYEDVEGQLAVLRTALEQAEDEAAKPSKQAVEPTSESTAEHATTQAQEAGRHAQPNAGGKANGAPETETATPETETATPETETATPETETATPESEKATPESEKDRDEAQPTVRPLLDAVQELTAEWTPTTTLRRQRSDSLDAWLDAAAEHLDLDDDRIDQAFEAVRTAARKDAQVVEAFDALEGHIPYFVYFSQYVKVQPRIHLGRLAAQEAAGDIDEDYDFGNLCLLRYLGLSALELADLGRGMPDVRKDNGELIAPSPDEVKKYQQRLDRRAYKLNHASNTLTRAINAVWGDDREVDILPDGQYLKVVVRNEDGARVELDQGSEGFRWLVSFHVVFEAQARSNEANAVLLLDEPAVSLHALKQEAFRDTITKIAARNQTMFTTHSPFMVGSNEMHRVRIVEMTDRETGTLVHQDFAVSDPRSLFLLQSHFGYELGETLFEQQRNLVVEAISDYWYLLALAAAARDADQPTLDEDVAVVPAGDAGKIAYHASVLRAHERRVAALFDSDVPGFAAASDEPFVHLMNKQRIHQTGDFYEGHVERPELEDLLRGTLLDVARDELGVDAIARAAEQPVRAVCDILGDGVGVSFSRYRLAKSFLRWMGRHGWHDLRVHERDAMLALFAAVNESTR
jgi:hypothetical protein